jgi:sugar phosphate isomerase/epimerase
LFGTDLVSGFTGRIPNTPLEQSLPAYQKTFSELATRAADAGVRLCFENCSMNGTWASGDWNIAINPDAWTLMWDALPNANLGLEWEPCHQMLMLIDPLPQLELWANKIFHLHGKDANIHWETIRKHGIGGQQPIATQRTAGFGDTNWQIIFRSLEQHGYTGALDIEGFHDPVYRDEREIQGQVKALEYLKTCRGAIL